MKNILTFQTESYIGMFMISGFSIFMIVFMFSAMDQFNNDVEVIGAYQEAKIKTINPTERFLIDEWLKASGISIPDGKGYRYVIENYPNKPWLK